MAADAHNGSHGPQVEEILRTWRRAELQKGDDKLMYFLLKGSAADLEVTASELVIRYDWHPSRHRYAVDAAPGIVSQLLEWCGARVVVEPAAFRFSGKRLPRAGLFWEMIEPSEAFDLWVFPGSVPRLMVRRATLSAERPRAVAPPEPVRAPYRTVELAQSVPCPHCGHLATSYRNLQDAWLCGACARSFPVALVPVPAP